MSVLNDYVVGFGSHRVSARATFTASVYPDVAFRPERVVIPASIASHFQVISIKINEQEQLRSIGTVPAEAFSDRSSAPRLMLDVARPSDRLSIKVCNMSDDEQVFQGGFYGPSI